MVRVEAVPDLPTIRSAFRAVDAFESPGDLLDYLDAFAAIEAVAAAKRRSFDLLGAVPGAAVLDVGCGTGGDVLALRGLVGPGGRAIGVDPSERAVETARGRGADCVVGGVEALPFADDEFDGCRADRVILHVERQQAAVAEMARVVKPGGRVVITEVRMFLGGADEDDPVTAGRVLGGTVAARRGDALVDRFVPLLLMRAGLTAIDVSVDEARVEDPDVVAAALSLRRDDATDDVARRWTERLLADVAAGRRWLAIHVLHGAGAQPTR